MKKLLLILSVSGCSLMSCKHFKDHVEKQMAVDSSVNRTTDTSAKKHRYDLAAMSSLDPDSVKQYSARYKAMVKESADNAVLIMNTSGACDAEIGNLADRISFIYGADENKKVTMIMEFYYESSNSSKYYMYSDFLNSKDPGMNGRSVLCPPPGSCQIGENITKKG